MTMHERPTILIVDDERFYLDVLIELLSNNYEVLVAKNGQQALKRAESKHSPDLILMDILMPEMDGYEVCRRLKNNSLTRKIPIIFLTAKSEEQDELKGFELGAVDYITKPISPPLLKSRVKTHIALSKQRYALEQLVMERTREIEQTKDSLVFSMGAMAELRDKETSNHLRRTEQFVRLLAEGLSETPGYKNQLDLITIRTMHRAAPMHDIGKVGVPDKILQKQTALNEEERTEMRQHTLYGRQLIEQAESQIGSTPFIRTAKEIAYSHHERWDGTGYPQGLSGTNIPLSARLMAVADVYDALASRRYYKEAIEHKAVVEEIKRNSGSHFDPDIVLVFLDRQNQIEQTYQKYRDD
jgi:putative two-component system response regulator